MSSRRTRSWRFFVNECLNFDVLEEKLVKWPKIPSSKIRVGWKGRVPPHTPPPPNTPLCRNFLVSKSTCDDCKKILRISWNIAENMTGFFWAGQSTPTSYSWRLLSLLYAAVLLTRRRQWWWMHKTRYVLASRDVQSAILPAGSGVSSYRNDATRNCERKLLIAPIIRRMKCFIIGSLYHH